MIILSYETGIYYCVKKHQQFCSQKKYLQFLNLLAYTIHDQNNMIIMLVLILLMPSNSQISQNKTRDKLLLCGTTFCIPHCLCCAYGMNSCSHLTSKGDHMIHNS